MKLNDKDHINLLKLNYVRKPGSIEDVHKYIVDFEDLDQDTFETITKLPIYNLEEIFSNFEEMSIFSANLFFGELKISDRFFIVRLGDDNYYDLNDEKDSALLVNTEGYDYIRYCVYIKDFDLMYNYYKKELDIKKKENL